MISKIGSGSVNNWDSRHKSLSMDDVESLRASDEIKIADDKRKSIGKEYKGDESLILQRIAENSGAFEFKEFLSIREGLKGSDRTLFTLSAFNLKDRLSDLNSVVKDLLSSYETNGFLKSTAMAGEKEAGMLLDIARKYRRSGSMSSNLTLVVSAASNLNISDMNNFIRAVHNGKTGVRDIYELSFGMDEKERSMFLSAAANAKAGQYDLVKWTKNLGKDLIRKNVLEGNMIFIGLTGDGQPVSARFIDGEFTDFAAKAALNDMKASLDNAEIDPDSARRFIYFLEKASNSKDGVDSFMKIMGRFGLDEKNRVFEFMDQISDDDLPNFVKAAASADDYELGKLMDMAGNLEGSDRANFLAAAAKADKNLSRFMAMAKRISGDLLSRFLSVAAKAGDNIGTFLDVFQQVENDKVSEMLSFLEEMDKDDTDNLYLASKAHDIPLAGLIDLLKGMEPENRKYFLSLARVVGIEFKALCEAYKNMDLNKLNIILYLEKLSKASSLHTLA